MKKFFLLLIILFSFSLISCHTRVVDAQKPMRDNSLELYQTYRIQKKDASFVKLEVVKVDSENIYGKTKTGAMQTIAKSDIYEIKKFDLLTSIAIGVAGVLGLILIPV